MSTPPTSDHGGGRSSAVDRVVAFVEKHPSVVIGVVGIAVFTVARALDELFFLDVQVAPHEAGRDYRATLMDLAGATPILVLLPAALSLAVASLVRLRWNDRTWARHATWLKLYLIVGSVWIVAAGAFEFDAARRGPCESDRSFLRSHVSVEAVTGEPPITGNKLVYLGTGPSDRIVIDCGEQPHVVYRLSAGGYMIVTHAS